MHDKCTLSLLLTEEGKERKEYSPSITLCHERAVRRIEAVAEVSRLALEVILSAALQTKTNKKEVEGASGLQGTGAV